MSETEEFWAWLIARQERNEQRLKEMQDSGGIKPAETPFMALLRKETGK